MQCIEFSEAIKKNQSINFDNCNTLGQNRDCGYVYIFGKNVFPCIPLFYYIKWGIRGVFNARICFLDVASLLHFAYPSQINCRNVETI